MSSLSLGSGGLPELIIALTGVAVLLVGQWSARAGRRLERRNDVARAEIDKDRQELEERRYTDDARDRVVERLNADIERERKSGEYWYGQYQKAVQHAMDADDRADLYRKRCDYYREHLHAAAAAIVSEATKAAAVDGVTDGDLPAPVLEDEDDSLGP